jgi:hypothetical protein
VTAQADHTLVVARPRVLGNDTDADRDALRAVLLVAPTHGTLTLNANGSYTYTPNPVHSGGTRTRRCLRPEMVPSQSLASAAADRPAASPEWPAFGRAPPPGQGKGPPGFSDQRGGRPGEPRPTGGSLRAGLAPGKWGMEFPRAEPAGIKDLATFLTPGDPTARDDSLGPVSSWRFLGICNGTNRKGQSVRCVSSYQPHTRPGPFSPALTVPHALLRYAPGSARPHGEPQGSKYLRRAASIIARHLAAAASNERRQGTK